MKAFSGDGETFTAEITSDDYKSWFEFDQDVAEFSEDCVIDEYKLVAVDVTPFIMQVGACAAQGRGQ